MAQLSMKRVGDVPAPANQVKMKRVGDVPNPDPKTYHGEDAVREVTKLEGELTPLQRAIVLEEGYVDSVYEDDAASRGIGKKNVKTRGVGQTGEFMDMTFKEALAIKVEEVKKRIPGYDSLNEDQQIAMVSLHYRGDLDQSPTFRDLWNKGEHEKAAEELLNHAEYKKRKSSGKPDGVVKRLEHNQSRLFPREEK